MDKKERARMRKEIADRIDIENERYSEKDLKELYDLVQNRRKYNGASKTYRNKYSGFSSEGKYVRNEEETYTINSEEDKVSIICKSVYEDDDGQRGTYNNEYSKGRDILKYIRRIIS